MGVPMTITFRRRCLTLLACSDSAATEIFFQDRMPQKIWRRLMHSVLEIDFVPYEKSKKRPVELSTGRLYYLVYSVHKR
jgi:hypothetical protein